MNSVLISITLAMNMQAATSKGIKEITMNLKFETVKQEKRFSLLSAEIITKVKKREAVKRKNN